MKNKKLAVLKSFLAMLLCVAMLIGNTFAWFTDGVSSGENVIVSGNLDLQMYWTDDPESGVWYDVEDALYNTIFSYDNWEPGYTEVRYIKLVNSGSLALNYSLALTPQTEVGKLAEVVNVYFANSQVAMNSRQDLEQLQAIGLLNNVMNGGATATGTLLPAGQVGLHPAGEVVMTFAMSMVTTAGNEYQGEETGDFTITALATQCAHESDSFGADYDGTSEYPGNYTGGTISMNIAAVDNKIPTGGVTMAGSGISAFVPEGTAVEAGTDKLTLTVTPLSDSSSNITVVNEEVLIPVDVHIQGIAPDNTKPIVIDMGAVLPKYLNMGNYHLYHVENGTNAEMTLVSSRDALTAHNTFTYDPYTGNVTVAMASFSEVALVADTENKWKGTMATSFSGGEGTEESPYLIANADQLAYMNDRISNANETYGDKHYKLLSDLNLGGESQTFYPIGYHKEGGQIATIDLDDAPEAIYLEGESGKTTAANSDFNAGDAWYTYGGAFKGVFDGNGNTISNIYQNTWSMKGNYDGNYWNAAMGLFGYVYGGTVKNLTVNGFTSDGEFTPTGVIAAYAAPSATKDAVFQNIAITNCNPRVYNTGNGGIVGVGGNTGDTATGKDMIFTNITVDNSNKISALWGSWDVACGGLMGMFRGHSEVKFTNCHVAAQIDAYNDVCGNYQYYWYRYSGMIIGSLRGRNKTENGYTVPNLDGITAENCTVHFGDWNNYYYCELVANSLASYTHDHQFSRLTEISSLDEIKSGDAWTKTGNFLLISGETKTCYHIVSKDGDLVRHSHEDAGEETVNGETVLKEDKKIVYLPFNQLFQGDGWGVKHVPIYDDGNTYFEGITILDRDVADSVAKFEKVTPLTEYPSGYMINIGDLFKAKENASVDIVGDSVQVFVSPKGEESTATGIYTANKADWTKGTLMFGGAGAATITISDYYYCTEFSFEVNIVEGLKIKEFDTIFPDKNLLYRVGNNNAVELGSLFSKLPGVSIQDASVAVETVKSNEGATVSGEFEANVTDWTKGTIKFAGTGVVKLTIWDCAYCTPTELYVEVVDAHNVTQYSDLKDGRNSVFLQKVTMAGGGTYRLTGNHVLYGNGFIFDVTNGAYSGVEYDYASYVIYLENSRLDNVRIEGAVYPEVGADKTKDYNRAIVMTSGDCTIVNSYISNGASPIRNGGNLELVNTTLKGGIYANLDLRNGHLILDNVTTINQIGANDKYNGTTEIVGMGVVVYQEGGTDELKITIKNKLTQYNYLSKAQADTYLTDTYAKAIKDVVFGNDFTAYQNNGWINFGIISMNNYFTADDLVDKRVDKEGYFGTEKPITLYASSRNCYVYSIKPNITTAPDYPGFETNNQGIIAPTVTFDFTEKNYQQKVDGSNDYCYEDGGTVFISMDEGDTVNWDTNILTIKKNGQTLDYTVKMNDTDYSGKTIPFNTSGEYEVVYSYSDPHNYDVSGTSTTIDYTKTLKINVSVVKQDAKNAEFRFGANGTAYDGKTVTIGDKTYVMPDVTATVSGKIGSKTVSGATVYYPITEMYTSDGVTVHKGSWYACFPIFKDAVQIVDYADKGTGDRVTYNQTNVTTVAQIPATLKAVDPKTAFLYSMNATNYPPPTDPTAVSKAVCYTCNRNGLTASNERDEMTVVAEYTYTDNAGKVYYYFVGYHCAEQTNGCVTPDTLITLADGQQVRVDQLKGDELLLTWNLETGKYEAAPIVFVDSEEETEYEIIHLYFSDGSDVKVISEHGFFDLDLGKYVYIDANNYADFVGHRFVALGDERADRWDVVTLDQVIIEKEVTTAWSPVTFRNLCYYTNGVLSMPGGIEGLFNIFEVNTATMRYDLEQKQADIEQFGLFTIDDFGGMITQEAFDAFNGAYLKVALAKGLLTWEDIAEMAERYIPLM